MQNPLQTTIVDTDIKEIKSINCIEASPLQDIVYVAGGLISNKARQSCPVLVIDISNHELKGK